MRRFFTAALVCLWAACGSSTPAAQTPVAEPVAPTEPTEPVAPTEPTPPVDEVACGDGMAAAELTAEQAQVRYGEGADKFADVPSSIEKPIEVCGVKGELQWLMVARCNDSTNPFSKSHEAHRARAGSMGAGGRCGHIIDRYSVTCPEGTYEVYMDLYMCGPNESLR